MRIPILALAAALLLPAAIQAGETLWQEVVPGVQLRLVSTGEVKPDGTTLFGLEIKMPPTTKTYWHVPGETGFPAELDLAGSKGVASAEIVWPHPAIDVSTGYLDYAYFGDTLLPIAVKVDDASGVAKVSALLGICSDICLPAQASFTLPVRDAGPDRPNGLRIRQALAEAPIPWAGGAEPLGKVEYLEAKKALAVEVTDPSLDVSSLIAVTDSGEPLFGMPQKSPQGDLVLLPILAKTKNIELKGRNIQLTFMTGMGAFELRRTIESDLASK
ncbi:protein-disulfide reductase DsbD domain-containing protein [Devosia soli]|nr:protein-disulfide reductase DsbD domain-containing protein [Devosia soli]